MLRGVWLLRYVVYRLLWLVPTLLAMALVTFLVMHATPGSPLDPSRRAPTRSRPRPRRTSPRSTVSTSRSGSSSRSSSARRVHGRLREVVRLQDAHRDRDHGGDVSDLAPARQHGAGAGGGGRRHARDAGRGLPESLVGLRLGERGHPRGERAELRARGVPDRALLVRPAASSRPEAGTRRRTGCCRRSRSPSPRSGIIARFTRSSMLEVIRSDYIVTARAKGLAEGPVILKHVLKNALHPGGDPARPHVRRGGNRLVLRGVDLPGAGHGPLLRALDDRAATTR